MSSGVYLLFINNSKEVMKFYEDVFNVKNEVMVLYKDLPGTPFPEEFNDCVLTSVIDVHGTKIRISDVPATQVRTLTFGNNFSIYVDYNDKELMMQEYEKLKEGGNVQLPVAKRSWAEMYCFITDKYGVNWQLSYNLHLDQQEKG